ncbi:MAG: putative zinc-binding metallopeptidase [Candidatus Nanopelagicales bacterium]
MRTFTCPPCDARVFFNDAVCLRCGTAIGYVSEADMFAFADSGPHLRCEADLLGAGACNWLVDDSHGGFCPSCELVEVSAEFQSADDTVTFREAIRRVSRQLHRLGIDPANRRPQLRFQLDRSTDDHRVTIGHEDGLVTLDLREADPVAREHTREALSEPYRTPLGHVRHESGHWHWQSAIESDPVRLDSFRSLFGDERVDYSTSLRQHYATDDDGAWRGEFLSNYAAAHPWEDYAESFAHVLHLLDTIETAHAEGLVPKVPTTFDELHTEWARVTVALNELSRSMGVADPYPFAPPQTAVVKMSFIYDALTTPWAPNVRT